MQNVPCALLAALLGATVRHSFLFCGDYYEVWYECGDGSPTTLTTLTLSQPSQPSHSHNPHKPQECIRMGAWLE